MTRITGHLGMAAPDGVRGCASRGAYKYRLYNSTAAGSAASAHHCCLCPRRTWNRILAVATSPGPNSISVPSSQTFTARPDAGASFLVPRDVLGQERAVRRGWEQMALDTKGLLCPMPIVKLAKAMKELDPQQVVLLESTDLCSVPDVAAWSAVKAR